MKTTPVKYLVKKVVKNTDRARLVQQTIENYINKSNLGFSVLHKIWFDRLQGDIGVIKKWTEIDEKNKHNYNIDNPIMLNDGVKIAVCNQWRKENLSVFISHAKLLGLEIKVKRAYTEKHYTNNKTIINIK